MSDEHTNPFEEIFTARWFWISAAVLAVAIVGLAVAYYQKHPERNIFEDFARRSPIGIPQTNGHVPGPTTPSGADVVGGEAQG
jgi:hypothetical protein